MKTPVECFTLKPVHCQSVAAIKEFQGENKWFLFYIQIYIPYTKKKNLYTDGFYFYIQCVCC